MANDVVLGAAMRSNLLSLQNTQRSIDSTQLRLATGKKINSALDGPQSFFTAQSLNNRASDLTRLLDGIGQSIRTIEEADKGVTALTALAEQAASIASSARDELASSDGEARAVGSVDLSETATLIGLGTIAANDVIRITTVNDAGVQIQENITIQTGETAYSLTAKITDQFADNRAGEIIAKVTDEGFISIESTGGRSFKIGDVAPAAATNVTLAGYAALGLDRYFEDETRGVNTVANATIIAGNTLKSFSLYESTGNLLDAGDFVINATAYTDVNGNAALSGFQLGDSFNFFVNSTAGTSSGAITLTATTTFQDVVDQINLTPAINQLVSADFDESTGQISFTSLSGSVQNFGITLATSAVAATRTLDIGLGDPFGTLDPVTSAASLTQETIYSFNSSTEVLDQLASDYNTVREQINDLVKDAQYRGVNLLAGDDLTTFFNEDNSSKLVTKGSNFTADGLGLNVASFRSLSDVELTSTEARNALNDVRAFGASLANNLSIIQTRRDFTEQTINTLKAGAADLTDADLNEEGANLLALQTAQQLGVTSLSLASQSQQSVLRLF